ncbi:MBL fold metallo-hydrolase [Sulfurospirillum sp. 1612]|uniref:MBL fold metallo-hydrolase n=1 Tax=Sulfurospirillum sp. 1612 TaxID=3094835 RepID=UPI002F948561
MQLKFLGTADSGGIPSHNCMCSICQDYRKKGDVNLATAAYIECDNGEIILLDAGVENIATIFDGRNIKAVFLTHFHADHVMGLLRLRYSSHPIDCYHPKDKLGFADIYKNHRALNFQENTPFQGITHNGITFFPVPLFHSKNTTGYIIQSNDETIAYLTDCAGMSEESLNFIKSFDLDTCYLDACLAPNFDNGNHLNYEQATILLDDIGAKNSHLIHSSHYTLDYIKTNHVTLKYDYILPHHLSS